MANYIGRKCEPDCTCGRHAIGRLDICLDGCTCKRHTAPKQGEESHNWAGKSISKRSIHSRIERQKGKAKEHDCVDCGDQAHDWSQIHESDEWEMDSYEPRCRSCHVKYDRNWEGS
jgi:hypothetical protein